MIYNFGTRKYVFTGIHEYTSLTRHITFPIPQVGNEQHGMEWKHTSDSEMENGRATLQPVCRSVTVHKSSVPTQSFTHLFSEIQQSSGQGIGEGG